MSFCFNYKAFYTLCGSVGTRSAQASKKTDGVAVVLRIFEATAKCFFCPPWQDPYAIGRGLMAPYPYCFLEFRLFVFWVQHARIKGKRFSCAAVQCLQRCFFGGFFLRPSPPARVCARFASLRAAKPLGISSQGRQRRQETGEAKN